MSIFFFLLKQSLWDPILASNKGDLELLNFSFLSLPLNCWDYLTNHDLLLLCWESTQIFVNARQASALPKELHIQP